MLKINKRQKKKIENAYKKNYYLYCNIANKYVKNFDDAEEVVTITFIYICKYFAKKENRKHIINDKEALEKYITNMVKFRAINKVRDMKRTSYARTISDCHLTKSDIQNITKRIG